MIIDLGRLPVGGVFHLDERYEVVAVGQETLTFRVGGRLKSLSRRSKQWDQFVRDVEGLVLASHHGVDAGCLTECIIEEK